MSHLQASINLHRFQLFVLLPQFVDIVAAAAREEFPKELVERADIHITQIEEAVKGEHGRMASVRCAKSKLLLGEGVELDDQEASFSVRLRRRFTGDN